MRYVVLVARFLLGAPFVFFGLNYFVRIVEPPAEMPERAGAFLQALHETGFMHELRSGTELVAGLLILSGCMVPLGLVILAPVLVHILLYHHYLDPQGLVVSYVLVGLELFLAVAYGSAFHGILKPCSKSRWQK